jgi:hypothetical protein
MILPYPPPFQDIAVLAEHLCVCESTIENWVRVGHLPSPWKIGGKRLWKWKDVERHLASQADGSTITPDEQADRIRNATKQASKH